MPDHLQVLRIHSDINHEDSNGTHIAVDSYTQILLLPCRWQYSIPAYCTSPETSCQAAWQLYSLVPEQWVR